MTAASSGTAPKPVLATRGASLSNVGAALSVGRLHIVAIAALGTLTFGWLFVGSRPYSLALLTALDWFLVNLLNRAVDLEEDRANGIAGTDFVAAHRRAVLVVGGSTLALSLVLVHLALPAVTPLRVAFHALGFAYNWPLWPGRRRIKQLYFWKNTASATGFLLTAFGYPLAVALPSGSLAPGIDLTAIAITGLFFFTFELSYEILYDLRDAPGDARVFARTYPVVHGERSAVRILDALLAISVASLATGYAAGALPWRIFVLALGPLLQLVLYKRALHRDAPRGLTSSDCTGLTWVGAALLLAYHLWIAAGLPGVGA